MADEDNQPELAESTGRKSLQDLLTMGPWNFDELRKELRLPPSTLEDELRHLDKSLRAKGQKLTIRAASCRSCSFEFTPRGERPFHAPRRCPKCKAERVAPPAFSIDD